MPDDLEEQLTCALARLAEEQGRREAVEQELHLRQLAIENASEAIMTVGRNGRFLDVNEAACRRLGYTRERLLTMSVSDIDPDYQPARWQRHWVEEIQQLGHVELETVHRTRLGDLIPVEVSGTYFVSDNEEYLVSFVRDLSDRKRAQAELQESELRFRHMSNQCPALIWLADEQMQATWFNQTWLWFVGAELAAELGDGWLGHFHPEDRARFLSRFRNAIARRAPFEMDYRLQQADGAYRWILSRGTPRFTEEKEFLGFVASGVDITERKEAEQELQASQTELRALTTELMMVEDRERRALAAELHEQVGQILAVCKLKLADLEGAGVDEITALVSEAIGRTRALTFELSSPILHELGLQEALESLCDEITTKYCIDTRFLGETEWEPRDETLAVFLFRSVRELLFNVVKHAQASTATVTLTRSDDQIQLSVADNGIGCAEMPPLRHQSGFGLFNIRQRLHHLGGRMQIDSPPAGGFRITLALPTDPRGASIHG